MAVVGLVLHPTRPGVVELATRAASWLAEHHHQTCLVVADPRLTELPVRGEGDDLDVAVSLGGDGTILRTVGLVSDADVPVIGVNLGHLGYLSEVEPSFLLPALERFLTGDHAIEERMRLRVAVDAGQHPDRPPVASYRALNEAVVAKSSDGQTARVKISVDGVAFTTYVADGVILATPTGSTAYAWSAGGPIVAPDHQALLLTPVAPHMLFDRSLVLAPGATVRLEIEGQPASLSVDGRNLGVLAVGDAVECTRADRPARLVLFEPRDFLQRVKAKFGLNDR